MKCDNCRDKCPQEELACQIAKGRMYATDEVIRLNKELELIRNQTIDEFTEQLFKELKAWSNANYQLSRRVANYADNYNIAKAYDNTIRIVDEIAKEMKGNTNEQS